MKFLRKRAYFWENRAGARKKQGQRTFIPEILPGGKYRFWKYPYLTHFDKGLGFLKG